MGKPHTFTSTRLYECIERDGGIFKNAYKDGMKIDIIMINRDSGIEGECSCGKLFKKTLRRICENGGFYCEECTHKNRISKTIEYNLQHYGVEHTLQRKDIREQGLKRIQEMYGSDITNISQVGVIKEQKVKTTIENYGVSHPKKSVSIKRGEEERCMEKYGVRHPSQDETIRLKMLKAGFQQKVFTMPSGRIVKVQGYEPFALNDLLKIYTESQIKVDSEGDMPKIIYTTEDGKTHRYYPDIFIPHENRVIEVKSEYTFGKGGRNVMEKKEATIKCGFVYEIWCYNGKGERVEV